LDGNYIGTREVDYQWNWLPNTSRPSADQNR